MSAKDARCSSVGNLGLPLSARSPTGRARDLGETAAPQRRSREERRVGAPPLHFTRCVGARTRRVGAAPFVFTASVVATTRSQMSATADKLKFAVARLWPQILEFRKGYPQLAGQLRLAPREGGERIQIFRPCPNFKTSVEQLVPRFPNARHPGGRGAHRGVSGDSFLRVGRNCQS